MKGALGWSLSCCGCKDKEKLKFRQEGGRKEISSLSQRMVKKSLNLP